MNYEFVRSTVLLGLAVGAALAPFGSSMGASSDASEWEVTAARGGAANRLHHGRRHLSVDVSPDGRWIVFDLLAHIYPVPIDGGEAQLLTQDSGVALNTQPRYSPDGKYIAFISDRGEQNNVWIMDADEAISGQCSNTVLNGRLMDVTPCSGGAIAR